MDKKAREQPTERILRLAAYAAAHQRDGITLDDVARDVPGYVSDGPRDAHGDLVRKSAAWETARKKLQRDAKDLADNWGIHLDAPAGSDTYRLRTPFLTRDERRALLAAAAAVDVEGIAGGGPGDLGAEIDDQYATVVMAVHPIVGRLREAIATRTPVTFRHEGKVRHLEPWALGEWHNQWYVSGHDRDADADRRYRLDRIEADAATGELVTLDGPAGSYEIPATFDAASEFDLDPNSWGTDPMLVARVRVGADHLGAFLRDLGGRVVERLFDAAVVELEVRHYESFRNRLLGYRGNATVLSPPELVAMIRDHLAALAGAS
ncbi:MAG: WYL domain-containing protein [Acidimicrobiia bacterium]